MKKAKTTTVARPAKPAKGPAPSRQKLQQEIVTLQHEVRSLKHSGTSKHQQHHKKHAKHSTHRKWSPDSDVALCSARAVAEALRIASGTVLSEQDVLTLHWQVGGDEDAGASILAALEGCRDYAPSLAFDELFHAPSECGEELSLFLFGLEPVPEHHALILGLDIPGGEPHAVAVDIDGTWWSWGEPWQPPADAVIEECWLVAA